MDEPKQNPVAVVDLADSLAGLAWMQLQSKEPPTVERLLKLRTEFEREIMRMVKHRGLAEVV